MEALAEEEDEEEVEGFKDVSLYIYKYQCLNVSTGVFKPRLIPE